MRILVASDAHGRALPVEKAIENLKPDKLIYLGDGADRIEELSYIYDDIDFYIVGGNCDFGDRKLADELVVCKKKIFFTHGHMYDVSFGLDKLLAASKARGADIVLYGHTHVAYEQYIDGIYVLNPGSPTSPRQGKCSVGFIDITDKGIVTGIAPV